MTPHRLTESRRCSAIYKSHCFHPPNNAVIFLAKSSGTVAARTLCSLVAETGVRVAFENVESSCVAKQL